MFVSCFSLERCGLAQSQLQFQGFGLERIGAAPGSIGRGKDMDDLFTSRMKFLENFFRESSLPYQCDLQLSVQREAPKELSAPYQMKVIAAMQNPELAAWQR